jgi:hypothetical protein
MYPLPLRPTPPNPESPKTPKQQQTNDPRNNKQVSPAPRGSPVPGRSAQSIAQRPQPQPQHRPYGFPAWVEERAVGDDDAATTAVQQPRATGEEKGGERERESNTVTVTVTVWAVRTGCSAHFEYAGNG